MSNQPTPHVIDSPASHEFMVDVTGERATRLGLVGFILAVVAVLGLVPFNWYSHFTSTYLLTNYHYAVNPFTRISAWVAMISLAVPLVLGGIGVKLALPTRQHRSLLLNVVTLVITLAGSITLLGIFAWMVNGNPR